MGKPQSSIQYRRMVAVPLITHNYELTVHFIYNGLSKDKETKKYEK